MRSNSKYFLFILLLFIASCKKTPNAFSVSDFPAKQGDTWTYKRIDSVTLKVDTVIWSLPGTVTINGKPMLLWVQTSLTQTDTGYWYINGDTITLYANGIISGATDIFCLPVQNGSFWSPVPTGGSPDTYNCSVLNTLSVNGTNYTNAFMFNRVQSGFDFSAIEGVDVVKGIGIVSYYSHQVNQGSTSTYQMSLLKYSLY